MLTELEFSDVARNKEESAKLLSLLVQNSQKLIKPYVDPMIAVLLPKACDPSPAVAATIMKAIGELACVGGEGMIPYIPQLMPIIIEALQDQSSSAKREASLRTLGQLASNSGYETIKLMGILGALDPYRHQQVEERSPEMQLRLESNQMTDISLMMTGLTPSNKEYFPTVVINALLNILKDPSLNQHHAMVIEAIMSIFRTLGSLEGEFKIYLAGLLPLMLGVLEKDTSTRRLPSERVLHAFLVFGSSAEEYMHLIVPVIVGVFEKQQQPSFIRKAAIETIDSNPVHLKAAWDATGKSTKEDWQEWMRKFSASVLLESPNHALRSCAQLASQYDAAIGILRKAQLYKDGITLRETWFEKLERWEEALEFYKRREEDFPDQAETFDVIMGKMRCLHALGEWESLSALAEDKWHTSSLEIKRAIAPLATAAAWGLRKWDLMDDYLSVMKSNTPDRSFFGAILALHRNQFREAALFVQKAREGLDTELSALVSESYNRAYTVVVRVQMLAELEELSIYKQSNNNPAKQEVMRRTWETRLLGCQRNVEVWQRMLKLRALVITPMENMQMSIKFANLCRKSGRMGLAEKHLKTLMGGDESLDVTFEQTN
ncbi:hypothetical protein DID88_004205 [Monilinia fructigena]|uniref:FAT domain-containing protein n=1 Tax=Monilinia fructigena TaxID=38457 RepID=A0A395IS58_9HELO|nr:hypothetical protein DID88_004205 [Monilinia fructigena]